MASHPSPSADPPGPPPADREELLEAAGPVRRRLYELIRGILDELEEAAPWRTLYYPPDLSTAFLAMEVDLLEVVDSIPGRIGSTLEPLLAEVGDEERTMLEDAEFYFSGIHAMVGRELGRLRRKLEGRLADPTAPIEPPERNFLAELTADLKGKYASALMGATASLVGEGLWTGVEVEPILFPEKALEFERNRRLLESLEELLEAMRRLPDELAIETLHERWREKNRVDRYALADLSTFRGRLGRLLQEGNRRALYSGDYHQIGRRESRLSERIHALEALHEATWSEGGDREGREAAFVRCADLLLEIAAVLDVGLLERLIGGGAVDAIRSVVMREREILDETLPGWVTPGGDERLRKRLPEAHRPLVSHLYEDDLATFVELLLGNVVKRASLREIAPAPATNVAEPARPTSPGETGDLLPDVSESVGAVGPAEESGAKTQTRAGPAAADSGLDRKAVLEGLLATLRRLQSPEHPHRRQLAMLGRLLEKHSRVPPSMLQSCEPYFHELLNELVPQLEEAVRLGAVPVEARQRLVGLCVSLSAPRVSPEQMETEVPQALSRVGRLLEALTSATAAALGR